MSKSFDNTFCMVTMSETTLLASKAAAGGTNAVPWSWTLLWTLLWALSALPCRHPLLLLSIAGAAVVLAGVIQNELTRNGRERLRSNLLSKTQVLQGKLTS